MFKHINKGQNIGYPIRESLDQNLLLAPQSISVVTPPVIASKCQLIQHKPYFICPTSYQIFGDKRTRTADNCLAKAKLYQLSYIPK